MVLSNESLNIMDIIREGYNDNWFRRLKRN